MSILYWNSPINLPMSSPIAAIAAEAQEMKPLHSSWSAKSYHKVALTGSPIVHMFPFSKLISRFSS